MTYEFLASLWLHEPDSATVARAVNELGLPTATPDELAVAYADLFLLNVYPYGTAYTDPDGELNAPSAHELATLYETQGYCPPELNEVAAPDHLGLCLGFLDHLSSLPAATEPARQLRNRSNDFSRSAKTTPEVAPTKPNRSNDFSRSAQIATEVATTNLNMLEWIPVCCLAVERDPTAHRFYRALAKVTREWLMADSKWLMADSGRPSAIGYRLAASEEITLRDLVRFFLAPAQCGLFLSRSRLGEIANELGLGLPFSSRFDVAETLFASAGAEHIERLIDKLDDEVKCWAAEYCSWAEAHPAWSPVAGVWLARTAQSRRTLSEMRATIAAEAV